MGWSNLLANIIFQPVRELFTSVAQFEISNFTLKKKRITNLVTKEYYIANHGLNIKSLVQP